MCRQNEPDPGLCSSPGNDSGQLDIEQPGHLEAYLRSTGRVSPHEPLAVRRLAGGVSNRTMLVDLAGGEKWVVKQGLAKLRVAVDWFSDPVRVHREALAMQWLSRSLPHGIVPTFLFEDRAHHLLAMQFVPEPHDNWKTLLLSRPVDSQHFRQFGEMLGLIHRRGYEQRVDLPQELHDQSLFESLRLEPYYAFTSQQVPEAAAFLGGLLDRTRARHDTFVHGDFSPKNILVHHGRLILLDHEVAHVGDPAFDIGFSLTHLLSKAHHRVDRRAGFARAANQYWIAYRQSLGVVPWQVGFEDRAVQHTLGCLLARVAGRSPVEYLQEANRSRQQQAVLGLLLKPPRTIAELIPAFLQRV
ncbi:MAG: phosphotransferase [Planctomycetia bacterium]|nr:phosphotransferase [Planctomycetia bacterium]